LVLEIPARGPRVFVSYSFSNVDVTAFEADLRTRGFRPTVVRATTLLGQPSLSGGIRQFIRDSDYVLPLVDAAASESAWVQEEIKIALEEKIPIVPVLDPGVEPRGPLRDIPCIVGGGVGAAADRILDDHTLLDFEPGYPAHISAAPLMDFMRAGRRPWVDSNSALSRSLKVVAESLMAVGHEQLIEQTRSQWWDLQKALDGLQSTLPVYRQFLKVLLVGYDDPEQRAVESFAALTRLIVGRHLIRFQSVRSPDEHPSWGELRDGARQMKAEWDAIDEKEQTAHLWLWGVGKRQFPLDEWSKDRESPLGNWLYATATLHDGQSFAIILPDEPVIASGLRLREPPARYLESWHWLDCILPQLADRPIVLRPDLGTKMLTGLRQG